MRPSDMMLVVLLAILGVCSGSVQDFMSLSPSRRDVMMMQMRTTKENASPGYATAQLDQIVDHTNNDNNVTFVQQYLYNDTFWDRDHGGPVFLLVGGEFGAAAWWSMLIPTILPLAQQMKALIVLPEHRFFGSSFPVPNLHVDNLNKLFTFEQAISDLAYFHGYVSSKFEVSSSTPWVAFGCSYSGVLASFFRTDHPELVVGAIVSSAPVYLKFDFSEFNEQAAINAADTSVGGSQACHDAIASGFGEFNNLLFKSDNASTIQKLFSTCSPFTNDLDKMTLTWTLQALFSYPFQWSKFYNPSDNALTDFCNEILAPGNSSFENIVTMTKARISTPCVPSNFTQVVEILKSTLDTQPTPDAWFMQYFYLECSQIGYYATCEEKDNCIFAALNVSFYDEFCQVFDISPSDRDARMQALNARYGGTTPTGTNIFSVNGSFDPYHLLSATTPNLSRGNDATVIKGAPHCANNDDPTPTDPPQLVLARKQVAAQVFEWVTTTTQAN
eukprot:TRINITY_DN1423_c0_g1_i3.p1 TRINITY_DN1423_c0_g1~~TRINITY_DN1423_c0_g1_i3.p1  ORF type:complete len:501 (-),score=102.71 TRINITY_DN1423_c0_g1_i3:94-1596(-)